MNERLQDYLSGSKSAECLPPLTFMGDRELQKVLKILPAGLKARPAESEEEIKAAYRLVYREYLSRGYCETNDNRMYFHSHCLLPSSTTFILEYQRRIAGTVTLIPDSPCGIPLETALPHLAGELRFAGRRIAEVSLLTLDTRMFSQGGCLSPLYRLAVSFLLFKTLLDYARHVAGVTDLLIMVHPKHEPLYRHLAFRTAGGVIAYKKALGNPGLPMHLDVTRLEEELPAKCVFRRFFFETPEPLEMLQRSWERTSRLVTHLLEETSLCWEGIFKGAAEYLKRRYLAGAESFGSFEFFTESREFEYVGLKR